MKRFSAVRFAALLMIVGGGSGLAGQSVELVSRIHPTQTADTGAGTSIQTFAPSVSADGRYVVFGSRAANLVPGQQDVNHLRQSSGTDVFLQDLATGTTTLVSHSLGSPAVAGNRISEDAVISRDGRYVAFTSHATDLAPSQTEGVGYEQDEDLLIYDRVTGVNTLLAAAPRNTGWASLRDLVISADGRYVAFTSTLDLQSGQQYQGLQVHLCDRIAKTVRLVSHTFASPTTGGDRDSLELSMSADGRYLTFVSSSSDLVPGQTSYWTGFLYDRVPGTLTSLGDDVEAVISADGRYVALISGDALLLDRVTGETTRLGPVTGFSSNLFDSRPLAISDDGRFVAFISNADDLVPGQQESTRSGLFLYDRVTRSYTLVSRRNESPTTPGEASSPTISADGRFVAFASSEPDLVAGQVQTIDFPKDIFLFERASGRVSLVSHASSSSFTSGNSISYVPTISANGARLIFSSDAANLVEGFADWNQEHDVFTYETSTERTAPVSFRAPETPSLSAADASTAKALSADGRFVAFVSESPHIVAGQIDTNRHSDVFLYDRSTRSTILVSRSAGSLTRAAQGTSGQPVLNADGRYVAFFSNATDLVPGASGPGQSYDLVFFDRVAGTMTRIAQALFNPLFEDQPAQISPDGRWVAFTSRASTVIPGQQEGEDEGTLDVFLWDRLTGSTSLVSRSTAGPTVAGDSDSRRPALSSDGRFVAFVSLARNLVPGQVDENVSSDLFLYDRMTGGMTLVSHTADSPLTAASIQEQGGFSMSANGRFLVVNAREALDPSVPFRNSGLYLYDRLSGTHQWIASDDGPAKISANGRWVVFLNDETLVPGFQNVFGDQVYLYDRISKAISLVSKPAFATGRASDGDAQEPRISEDGRYVAFLSNATNLLAGQTADRERDSGDLFLFDRLSGTMTLLSRSQTSPVTTLGYASDPVLSSSGRQVAFTSSRDLVAGDLNLQPDAYIFSLDPLPPITLPNCTLFDTSRRADRPALTSNVQRTVTARGACGVPATAKQVVVKVTVSNPSGKGNLQFYPGTITAAPSGILRFERNATRTEMFTLPLSANGVLTLLPFVASKGTVHVALEVTGFAN